MRYTRFNKSFPKHVSNIDLFENIENKHKDGFIWYLHSTVYTSTNTTYRYIFIYYSIMNGIKLNLESNTSGLKTSLVYHKFTKP